MRAPLVRLRLYSLVSILFVSLLSIDCTDPKPNSPQWKTDPQGLQSRLPFLTSVESCWWLLGVAEDRSTGSVPGPSSSFLRGYAKLSPQETSRLTSAYQWTSIPADSFKPVQPPDQYQVPAMSGRLLTSEPLMRSLVAATTFRNGQIVLAPDQNMIYFDLAQD